MSLEVATTGYKLDAEDGEHIWFADSLLTYKVTGTQSNGGLALAEVRAERGACSPTHSHAKEDEAWYVLEGELAFQIGVETVTATAGDFVFGPRGVSHRFEVVSSTAHFLLLLTPAGFEQFTRDSGWP